MTLSGGMKRQSPKAFVAQPQSLSRQAGVNNRN